MFVLPIIAGTFTTMSIFLTLPLLSLLSFQSIPTIDWCSCPTIAAYLGDIIDIGMNVAPRVTCCAITSAGFFVLALLAFLSYHAVQFGSGSNPFLVSESEVRCSTPVLSGTTTPQTVTSAMSQEDASLADVTLVEDVSSLILQDPSLPKIVALMPDLAEYKNIVLHALSPSSSMIDIPMDATDDRNAIFAPLSDTSTGSCGCISQSHGLSSHGSITTNLVDISGDLHYEDTDSANPWLASPEPELDSEFTVHLQQLIASIAALEAHSVVNKSTRKTASKLALNNVHAHQCTTSSECDSQGHPPSQRLSHRVFDRSAPQRIHTSNDQVFLVEPDKSCADEIHMQSDERKLTTALIDSGIEHKWRRTRRGGKRMKRSLATIRAEMTTADALAMSLGTEVAGYVVTDKNCPPSASTVQSDLQNKSQSTLGLAMTGLSATDDRHIDDSSGCPFPVTLGLELCHLIAPPEARRHSKLFEYTAPFLATPTTAPITYRESMHEYKAMVSHGHSVAEDRLLRTLSPHVTRTAGGLESEPLAELRSAIPEKIATFVARRNPQTKYIGKSTPRFADAMNNVQDCCAEIELAETMAPSEDDIHYKISASVDHDLTVDHPAICASIPRSARPSRFGP